MQTDPNDQRHKRRRRKFIIRRKRKGKKGKKGGVKKSNWDGRFSVADSKDNQKVHKYYKQYFDKQKK